MNIWTIEKKFNKTSLPEKEDFYSYLNNKDITDADYSRAERVCKDFEIKKLGEYHDLNVKSDVLLLTDLFENFRNMCIKMLLMVKKSIRGGTCGSFIDMQKLITNACKTMIKIINI